MKVLHFLFPLIATAQAGLSALADLPTEIQLMIQDRYTHGLQMRVAVNSLHPEDPDWPGKWPAKPAMAVHEAERTGNGTLLRFLYDDDDGDNGRELGLSRYQPRYAELSCLHVSRGDQLRSCPQFYQELNNRSSTGWTPLHLADDEGVRVLIDAGADCIVVSGHPPHLSALSLALLRVASASAIDGLLECSSSATRSAALPSAAAAGNYAVVTSIIAEVAAGESGDDVIGTAYVQAAGSGHVDVMAALKAAGHLTDIQNGQAFRAAARGGHLAAMGAALATRRVHEEALSLAYLDAAQVRDLNVLRAIAATGMITYFYHTAAYFSAARNGHVDVMAAVYAEVRQDKPVFGDAYASAAQEGQLAAMAAVLATGLVEDKSVNKAYVTAAERGHANAMAAALATGRVKDSSVGEAYVAAAESGHADAMAAAFATGRVPKRHLRSLVGRRSYPLSLPVLEAALTNLAVSRSIKYGKASRLFSGAVAKLLRPER